MNLEKWVKLGIKFEIDKLFRLVYKEDSGWHLLEWRGNKTTGEWGIWQNISIFVAASIITCWALEWLRSKDSSNFDVKLYLRDVPVVRIIRGNIDNVGVRYKQRALLDALYAAVKAVVEGEKEG